MENKILIPTITMINGVRCQSVEEYTLTEADMLSLDEVKAEKINAIEEYSNSDAVNGFIYNGKKLWIDRQDRIILIGETIPVAEMLGKSEITLSLGDVVVTMPIAYVKQVLNAITAYAVNCYEVTNAKKAAVNACTSIDEVNAIDVADGYPEMLTL